MSTAPLDEFGFPPPPPPEFLEAVRERTDPSRLVQRQFQVHTNKAADGAIKYRFADEQGNLMGEEFSDPAQGREVLRRAMRAETLAQLGIEEDSNS